jgi:hypothetical protein
MSDSATAAAPVAVNAAFDDDAKSISNEKSIASSIESSQQKSEESSSKPTSKPNASANATAKQNRLEKERLAARSKVEKIRLAHEAQVAKLEQEKQAAETQATLLETNSQAVDACIQTLNAELAKGLDWRQLAAMLEHERSCDNVLAKLIDSLQLDENCATLLLSPQLQHLTQPDSVQPIKVKVDLSLSAHVNAERQFSRRKAVASKADKTQAMSAKVLKQQEQRAKQTEHQIELKQQIQNQRQFHAFERFNWFVSSEDFLVVSGRTAKDAHLLLSKHMSPNDCIVSCSAANAPVMLIKNHLTDGQPVPPLTLSEAGTMSIARSDAYKDGHANKISSHWFNASEITVQPEYDVQAKTCFTANYQPHVMPRTAVSISLALIFRVADSDANKHVGERRIRSAQETQKEQVESNQQSSNAEPAEAEASDASVSDSESRSASTSDKSDDEQNEDDETSKSNYNPASNKAATACATSKPAPHISSKRLKAKKRAALKYAEQDDEDRLIAAQRLGLQNIKLNKQTSQNNQNNAANSAARLDSQDDKQFQSNPELPKETKQSQAKSNNQPQQQQQPDSDNQSSSKSSNQQQHQKQQPINNNHNGKANAKGKSKQPKTGPNSQKGDQDSRVKQISNQITLPASLDREALQFLTGQPLDDDKLLFCMPVCAPTSALLNYKYCVKLVPGTQKKGRMLEAAKLLWNQSCDATDAQRALIVLMPVNESVHNLPSNARIGKQVDTKAKRQTHIRLPKPKSEADHVTQQ